MDELKYCSIQFRCVRLYNFWSCCLSVSLHSALLSALFALSLPRPISLLSVHFNFIFFISRPRNLHFHGKCRTSVGMRSVCGGYICIHTSLHGCNFQKANHTRFFIDVNFVNLYGSDFIGFYCVSMYASIVCIVCRCNMNGLCTFQRKSLYQLPISTCRTFRLHVHCTCFVTWKPPPPPHTQHNLENDMAEFICFPNKWLCNSYQCWQIERYLRFSCLNRHATKPLPCTMYTNTTAELSCSAHTHSHTCRLFKMEIAKWVFTKITHTHTHTHSHTANYTIKPTNN